MPQCAVEGGSHTRPTTVLPSYHFNAMNFIIDLLLMNVHNIY